MNEAVVLAFVLLFVKHWYIDFVDQSMDEVNSKGNYGEWLGIRHSFKHGFATFIILLYFTFNIFDALWLGIMDFVIHYHTDWAKININRKKNYTVETPQFWAWLGADQLVHSFTYLYLVWLLV